MKRYITLFYLVLCLVTPTLSHGAHMTTMVYDRNEQSVEQLNVFSRVETSGPYQFRVLKDAVETRGVTKDLDGRVFTTSDGTRYYYRMNFYRDKLPKDIRIEQLRQMIMDVRFVNHTI